MNSFLRFLLLSLVYLVNGEENNNTTMSQKVAVVTGANKGIGYAIVRGLCKRFDGLVYLTARSEERGRQAKESLEKEGCVAQFHQLDITDPQSIEKFRDHLQKEHGGFDILINNAATMFGNNARESVAEQAEQTLFVNYFSVLSTCDILLPTMRDGGRVINLSSSYGRLSNIPSAKIREQLSDPNLTIPKLSDLMRQYVEAAKKGTHRAEWGSSSYAVSKVGLTALSRVQQRLLNDRNIKVNAADPGWVNTDLSGHTGPLTIDQGAETPLWLALDAPDSVRGEFVSNKRVTSW